MMRASSSLSFTRVSGTSTTKPSATIGSGSGGATIVRITEHLVLGVIRFLNPCAPRYRRPICNKYFGNHTSRVHQFVNRDYVHNGYRQTARRYSDRGDK